MTKFENWVPFCYKTKMFRFMGNDLQTNKHTLLLEYTCKYARKQNIDVYKKKDLVFKLQKSLFTVHE